MPYNEMNDYDQAALAERIRQLEAQRDKAIELLRLAHPLMPICWNANCGGCPDHNARALLAKHQETNDD